MHLGGINRLDTAEEKISELEDITIDTIENERESDKHLIGVPRNKERRRVMGKISKKR